MTVSQKAVFVTGGTGHMGRGLIGELLRRGHRVKALARPGSESKLPRGCEAIPGNALDGASYRSRLSPGDVFVQLVGVSPPNPLKPELFRTVDFTSGKEAVAAAKAAGVKQFVYVSVAQPAPIMAAYIAARADVEKLLAFSGMNATILRPWYVLALGRRSWPALLLPFYWFFELIPSTRPSARRLGLVTSSQMTRALVQAVETPAWGTRLWEVPQIRRPPA